MKRTFSIVDKMSALYIFLTLIPITLIVLNAQAENEALTGGVKFSFLACFAGSVLCTLFRLGLQLFRINQQEDRMKKRLGLLYTAFWTLVTIVRLIIALIASGFSLRDDELRFYLMYHGFLVGMIVIQWLGQKLFEEERSLEVALKTIPEEKTADVNAPRKVSGILSVLAGMYVVYMAAVLMTAKMTNQLPVGEELTKLCIAMLISFVCVQFRFVVKYSELSKRKKEVRGKLYLGYQVILNMILVVGLVWVWVHFEPKSSYLEKLSGFQTLQMIIVIAQSFGRRKV